MPAELRFERIAIRAFRNITSAELEPAPRLNVVSGDNGHGKTSLLEALYVLATSKSFRADKNAEVIQTGAESALVSAKIREAGLGREQRAVLGPRARVFSADGKRIARLSLYATKTPVVVFHPGDLALASGPALGRRTLLDRVALFLEPVSADHRSRYAVALRERQRALDERGTRAAELDAYEAILAEHGAALCRIRERTAARLAEALGPAFASMAAPELSLSVRLRGAGSTDPEEFRRTLTATRPADLRRGSASFGPQRDDLELDVDGRSARRHASQGQQRVLSLALKVAELDCVRQARGAHPVLLLDDVSSELDAQRFEAVFALLRDVPSQVFVTTPRPELFVISDVAAADRADFSLLAGAVSRLR
ncbi:MAG: DNA replication and repair protein RecF [Myxococcales bacterium]|nr:DNA replication and repair protein RecF [Myxococcales bacterium]